MPMQYVVTFLLVSLDQGRSVADYARKLGVSPSVMSRHLLDIGDRNRHMTEGFGLVTMRKNPENERENQYFLTDKGRAIYQQLVRRLEG
jgi:DNA-binding MarR family transcriptional regulator